jgi:hypothetical protein
MAHPHSHLTHLHVSRPMDRGAMEGLPALSSELQDRMAEPRVDADTAVVVRRRRLPSRTTRISFEAAVGIALAGMLYFLLSGIGRAPTGSEQRCPAGTKHAVALATSCSLEEEDDLPAGALAGGRRD